MAGDGGLVESLEDHMMMEVVLVENLEDHNTETEMEDELPRKIRSEQRGPEMTHQQSS